jgi:hypothetical protein
VESRADTKKRSLSETSRIKNGGRELHDVQGEFGRAVPWTGAVSCLVDATL